MEKCWRRQGVKSASEIFVDLYVISGSALALKKFLLFNLPFIPLPVSTLSA